jgi:exosome complex RNA-binding protein Rrp42 (RNase PH superfamily)
VPDPLYSGPINISNIQTFEILRFTAKNGSADVSRDTEQLVCEVADNIGDPYLSDWFYVDNTRANGAVLSNNQFVVKVNANTANTYFASNPNSTYSINLQIKVYDSNETSVPAGLNLISRTVEFTDQ